MTSSLEHASPVGLFGQGCISSHSPKVRGITVRLWPCLGDLVLGLRLLALHPLGEFPAQRQVLSLRGHAMPAQVTLRMRVVLWHSVQVCGLSEMWL